MQSIKKFAAFDGDPIPPRNNFTCAELACLARGKAPANEAIRYLPYGEWTCKDRRKILFTRAYLPLLQKERGAVSQAHPGEWFDVSRETFFFDDWASPKRNPETRAKCEKLLVRWLNDASRHDLNSTQRFLLRTRRSTGPVELALDIMRTDPDIRSLFPSLASLRDYFQSRHAAPEAIAAASSDIWRRYATWTARHPFGT